MLTLTGNGRLTRDVELRSTRSGDSVATVSVASDRRDRRVDPLYVDLIVWRGPAEAAAAHLVKGGRRCRWRGRSRRRSPRRRRLVLRPNGPSSAFLGLWRAWCRRRGARSCSGSPAIGTKAGGRERALRRLGSRERDAVPDGAASKLCSRRRSRWLGAVASEQAAVDDKRHA